MSSREKIIIDTDIGDDIDDALAIALALNSPELELIGITTVYKNTLLRARIAQSILKVMECETIPVVQGLANPFICEVDTDEIPCQFYKEMEELAPKYNGDAVDFIIDKTMSEPGNVTLVAIGALTNIAATIERQPEIKKCIKRIVLMGGAYFVHINEYNIACDPEAAKIVFNSGIPIVAVGLDVTIKCSLKDKELNRIKGSKAPIAKLLSEMVGLYNNKHKEWPVYLHDPLAIAVMIDNTLVNMEEKLIDVEIKGELTRGMTFNISDSKWWSKEKSTTNVCTDVDRDRLVEMLLNRIC